MDLAHKIWNTVEFKRYKYFENCGLCEITKIKKIVYPDGVQCEEKLYRLRIDVSFPVS